MSLWSLDKHTCKMPRHWKTSCMLAVESIKTLAKNVSLVKGRGCNDKSTVFPKLIYNFKHTCIVVLNNKVMYANVVSHTHRHASYIWSCVASYSIVLIGEVDRHFTPAPAIQCPIEELCQVWHVVGSNSTDSCYWMEFPHTHSSSLSAWLEHMVRT